MIAGAFSFDCVMLVVAATEGIMPQTVEHIEIINLLGIKEIVVVLTKKDLVSKEQLELQKETIEKFLKEFEFDIKFICCVSIYEEKSIENLKDKLFTLKSSSKPQENFFRYYVDRVFSVKGIGTVVTGTVLGNQISLDEKVFIPHLQKETKIKIFKYTTKMPLKQIFQIEQLLIFKNIKATELQRGDLISKKGFLRGFDTLDISFKCLKGKNFIIIEFIHYL